jgi:TPR repeat protein
MDQGNSTAQLEYGFMLLRGGAIPMLSTSDDIDVDKGQGARYLKHAANHAAICPSAEES